MSEMIAVIGNVYANPVALRAVLDDIREQGVTRVWCAGNLLDRGPQPVETARLLREVFAAQSPIDRRGWVRTRRDDALIDPGGATFAGDWTVRAASMLTKSPEATAWLTTLAQETAFPQSGVLITGRSARLNPFAGVDIPRAMLNMLRPGDTLPALVLFGGDPQLDLYRSEMAGAPPERIEHTLGMPLHVKRSPFGVIVVQTGAVGVPGAEDPRASYVILTLDPMLLSLTVRFRAVSFRLDGYTFPDGYPVAGKADLYAMAGLDVPDAWQTELDSTPVLAGGWSGGWSESYRFPNDEDDEDLLDDHFGSYLTTRAREWSRYEQDNAFLLTGDPLEEAKGWLAENQAALQADDPRVALILASLAREQGTDSIDVPKAEKSGPGLVRRIIRGLFGGGEADPDDVSKARREAQDVIQEAQKKAPPPAPSMPSMPAPPHVSEDLDSYRRYLQEREPPPPRRDDQDDDRTIPLRPPDPTEPLRPPLPQDPDDTQGVPATAPDTQPLPVPPDEDDDIEDRIVVNYYGKRVTTVEIEADEDLDTPPPGHTPDDPQRVIVGEAAPSLDDMDEDERLRWMESLAKRQGANDEELITEADLDVPQPAASEENTPGYVPYEVDAEGTKRSTEEMPAVAAPANETPDFENMSPDEMMRWMESLAKRQGANTDELLTSADADIAEVDPDTVVDEPGYVPFGETKPDPKPAAPPPAPAPPFAIADDSTEEPEDDESMPWLDALASEAPADDDLIAFGDAGSPADPQEEDRFDETASRDEDVINRLNSGQTVSPEDMEAFLSGRLDRTLNSEPLPQDADDADSELVASEMPDWLGADWAAEEPMDDIFDPSGVRSGGNLPEKSPVEDKASLPDWLGEVGGYTEPDPAATAELEWVNGSNDTAPSLVPEDGSPVQFSAYYPREPIVNVRHGFYVYAHLEGALAEVNSDVKRFVDELGGTVPPPKTAKQSALLAHGTPVTVVPECDDLSFEPASQTKTWQGDWTRYGFDFRAPAELADEPVVVRVSVQVLGVEVASIRCGMSFVAEGPFVAMSESTADKTGTFRAVQLADDNPLAAAKFASTTASVYQRIFVSYSRRDIEVADAYRKVQQAIGNEVFMDTYNIRSGEDWRAALARAIDEADIFQLFWSEHSASSKHCRDEWDYAIKHRCAEDGCASFIRPVFWSQPMPAPPPDELGHLNFRYVPLQNITL